MVGLTHTILPAFCSLAYAFSCESTLELHIGELSDRSWSENRAYFLSRQSSCRTTHAIDTNLVLPVLLNISISLGSASGFIVAASTRERCTVWSDRCVPGTDVCISALMAILSWSQLQQLAPLWWYGPVRPGSDFTWWNWLDLNGKWLKTDLKSTLCYKCDPTWLGPKATDLDQKQTDFNSISSLWQVFLTPPSKQAYMYSAIAL